MNGFIGQALQHRKVTLLFTVVAVLYGILGYNFIPKQENPEFPSPAAIVITIYPGASPVEVEELVTKKIEDAIVDIKGFDRVQTFSRNSVSIAVVFLEASVTDVDSSWDELRQNISDVESDLPDACEKPDIDTNLGETAGMLIALSGDGYSYDQLVSFSEEFKRELSKVQGISRFEIAGEVKRVVKIEVEAEKLLFYDLSMENVLNLIQLQNLAIPSGYLEKGGIKINVSTPGTFETLKDIEDTIVTVSQDTGAVVRLKDFAKVYFDEERGASKIKQNGENAVLLAGYFKSGRNVVLIGDDVRDVLEKVKQRLPERLIVDEVLFQPADVDRAVTGFMSNLAQGIVLVILVVFLGMGLRNAMIVSTAIPISVTLTFAVMGILGITIQQVSTMALIISLGMLVDNAIVIADAVQVRIDAGMKRIEAALDGAKDSALPVFSATLTTVAAYAPLLFLPGAAGQFTSSLPLVVIVALGSSYVVAMLVTPSLASLFFRPLPPEKTKDSAIRKLFYTLLDMGLKRRWTAIAIAVGVFMGAMWLRGHMGVAFFPPADKQFSHLEIRSEQADLDKAEAISREVEAILRAAPEIVSTTTSIGEGLPKFFFTVGKAAPSDNYAQILYRIDLEKGERFERNSELIFALQQEIEAKVPGATVSMKQLSLQGDGESPVEIRVSGQDLNRIQEVAFNVKQSLASIDGTFDVTDDSASKVLQVEVDVDEDAATSSGLSKYDILRQINIALYGSDAGVYRSAGLEYDIVVTSDIKTVEELQNLGVKSRFGPTKLLLKQVADMSLSPQLEIIRRYNRERSISVKAKAKPGYSAAALEDTFEFESLPTIDTDGVNISFYGDRERISQLFGGVAIAALAAIAVVYIILFVQFNSFLRPMVILLTVPLSSIGAILGLFIFRQDLSFTAVLGMASLVGIVVNNAILLIDYIDKARERGDLVDAACVDAVKKRYRPIMLSTTTTALGLTPLLISYNPLFTPMAISLMAGLMVSTLLTLVIIPVVFSLVFRREDKKMALGSVHGGGETPPQAP